jgi:hypothetical protein
MPNYNFRHRETGETQEVFLRISELDAWKEDNPDWESYFPSGSAPAMVSQSKSTLSQAGDGWKDLLNRVKEGSGQNNTIKT